MTVLRGSAPRRQRTPAEQETHERLVRQFAADPVQQAWLRNHTAEHVEREAQALAGPGRLRLEAWAREHRAGDTALW